MATQPKNNNFVYMVDLKFNINIRSNINRLFVQSFKAGENDLTSNSSDEYYIPLSETKGFSVLFDKKSIWINPYKQTRSMKLIDFVIPPKLLYLHWN